MRVVREPAERDARATVKYTCKCGTFGSHVGTVASEGKKWCGVCGEARKPVKPKAKVKR